MDILLVLFIFIIFKLVFSDGHEPEPVDPRTLDAEEMRTDFL